MIEKIKGVVTDITSHWKTPAEGKYIPYKEFAAYSIGGIGVNTINSLFNYVALNANCLLIGSAYGIKPTHLAGLNIIMGIINLIKAPFISMMIDNTNSKYGKFRPYLLYTGVPTAILLCLMAFLPNDIAYGAKVAFISITYAFLMIFQALYAQAFTSLAQVLTPNGEERTGLLSVSMFIYSLGPSIVNMLLPILSGLTGGMTDFRTYRIFFPIFSIAGIALSIITFSGTKEKLWLQRIMWQRSDSVRVLSTLLKINISGLLILTQYSADLNTVSAQFSAGTAFIRLKVMKCLVL